MSVVSHDCKLPLLAARQESACLRLYAKVVAWLCHTALMLASVLIILELLLIGATVLLRYAFSTPILGSDELIAASLTMLVMLSAPDVLRRNGHIGVDMLANALPPRAARWAAAWSSVAVLMVALLLIINGCQTVALSRMIGLLTQGDLEMPVWVLQLFLPLGGVLLALAAVEQLWRCFTVPPDERTTRDTSASSATQPEQGAT